MFSKPTATRMLWCYIKWTMFSTRYFQFSVQWMHSSFGYGYEYGSATKTYQKFRVTEQKPYMPTNTQSANNISACLLYCILVSIHFRVSSFFILALLLYLQKNVSQFCFKQSPKHNTQPLFKLLNSELASLFGYLFMF